MRNATVTFLALGLSLYAQNAAEAADPIAQVICAPSEQMMTRLSGRMGSERIATGLRSPEELVEIWTDAQGDWTMVITYSTGKSCIVAMGEHWTEVAAQNPT